MTHCPEPSPDPADQPPGDRGAAPMGRPKRIPWLTILVSGLCVFVTVADHLALGAPASWAGLVDRICRVPLQSVWAGAWWAMVTSVFVHGTPASVGLTLLHLGFNLVFFARLGAVLENTLTRAQWLAFFATAALVSSGAEIAVSSSMSVGVSGVLFALFGLMWAGRRVRPEWAELATPALLLELAAWGLFCVVMTVLFRWPIANAAHGGGFLYGLAVGWYLRGAGRRLLAGAALGALAALPVLAATWMPWSGVWCEWRGAHDASQRRYASAVSWYRRSLRLGQPPEQVWAQLLAAQMARGDARGAGEALRELARRGALRVLVGPPASRSGIGVSPGRLSPP